jgi:hypothetical protein
MSDKFYTAEVYVHRDLENSKREHISISGGRATHQYYSLIALKDYKTLYDIVKKIKETYGEPYDNIDGTLFIGVDERAWDDPDCPEHIEVRIYENTKKAVDISEKEPFKCRKCGCEELKDSKQQDETVCLSCEMEGENNDRN